MILTVHWHCHHLIATMTTADQSIYAQGFSFSEDWYHGEMSRVEAENALAASGQDCFMVRASEGALILSLVHHGQLHHVNIKYGPGWYELEIGSAQYSFTEMGDLVDHYCTNNIGGLNFRIATACVKTQTASR